MAVLPRAEKLPLAVRKNLRDEFEAKKEQDEKRISDKLGVPWTFNIDANEIWPYHNDNELCRDRIGSLLRAYSESAASGMRDYADNYGAAGIKELNTIVYKHSITMKYDDTKKFSYCGCKVVDGELAILFSEGQLGTNTSDALERNRFAAALSEAEPAPGADAMPLSFVARAMIRKNYDPKIEEIRSKIADMVKVPDFKLNPNFEENFATMKKHNGADDVRDDWERNLGSFTADYFGSLRYYLNSNKFATDDMLQEGFQEAVDKNEAKLVVVEKLETPKGNYNELIVKGGVLYLQTVPKYFGTNVNDVAAKIVDML